MLRVSVFTDSYIFWVTVLQWIAAVADFTDYFDKNTTQRVLV